jgi:hypothetical protein
MHHTMHGREHEELQCQPPRFQGMPSAMMTTKKSLTQFFRLRSPMAEMSRQALL